MALKFLVNNTNTHLVLFNDAITVAPYKSVSVSDDDLETVSLRYLISNKLASVSDVEMDFAPPAAEVEETVLVPYTGMTLDELRESEKEDSKTEKEGITVTPIGGTPQPAKAPKASKAA